MNSCCALYPDALHDCCLLCFSVETPIGVAISSASSSSGNSNSSAFPYMKSLDQLQEQSVAPATHFVYALTW